MCAALCLSWGESVLPLSCSSVCLRGRLRDGAQICFAMSQWPQTVLIALWVAIYMSNAKKCNGRVTMATACTLKSL